MKCKRLTIDQVQDLLRVALDIENPWFVMLHNDSIDVGASKLIRMRVNGRGGEMRWFRWFLIGPVRDVRYWFELV